MTYVNFILLDMDNREVGEMAMFVKVTEIGEGVYNIDTTDLAAKIGRTVFPPLSSDSRHKMAVNVM